MISCFIKVPILLFSSYEANILDKNPHELQCIDCEKYIDINRIESYAEAIPLNEFSEDNKCWTTVIMHSKDDFIVTMPINKFKELINNATKSNGTIRMDNKG